jgi:hypothetical protein
MKHWRLMILIGLVCLIFPDFLSADQPEKFKIVINASAPFSRLKKKDLSNIFLKTTTRWQDSNEIIYPVDLLSDSPVRVFFSQFIHGKTISAVKAYWQQQIFSGRKIPPLEKSSDEEVMRNVEQKTFATALKNSKRSEMIMNVVI